MVNVGIAGVGFMGMIHYLAYQKVKGAKVRALCEQDPARLAGDWRTIKGNFGPAGKIMDLTGIARYAKLDDLLADPHLDAVDVCLPPGLHAEVTVRALRAGKHVFCEKPIALTPADADRMVSTAKKAGKLLMIGHVLPFFPEYRFAYQTIRSGKYGRLLGGDFKRVISDPTWLPDFFNPRTIGGPMIDLHIHDAHFIRLLCGMPKAVHTGIRERTAFRASIQIMLRRSIILRPSLHPDQPEKITLQFLFLDLQLRRRRPGVDQEAADVVRAFDRGSAPELYRAVLEDLGRLAGGDQRPARRLNVPRPQQQPPASIPLQLVCVELLEQVPFVDNPDPPGKT